MMFFFRIQLRVPSNFGMDNLNLYLNKIVFSFFFFHLFWCEFNSKILFFGGDYLKLVGNFIFLFIFLFFFLLNSKCPAYVLNPFSLKNILKHINLNLAILIEDE